MNLPVYNGTTFFTNQNITQTKISYGHVTKIPRDDSQLSEATIEVNGNDPCKRVVYCMMSSNRAP